MPNLISINLSFTLFVKNNNSTFQSINQSSPFFICHVLLGRGQSWPSTINILLTICSTILLQKARWVGYLLPVFLSSFSLQYVKYMWNCENFLHYGSKKMSLLFLIPNISIIFISVLIKFPRFSHALFIVFSAFFCRTIFSVVSSVFFSFNETVQHSPPFGMSDIKRTYRNLFFILFLFFLNTWILEGTFRYFIAPPFQIFNTFKILFNNQLQYYHHDFCSVHLTCFAFIKDSLCKKFSGIFIFVLF